MTTETSSSAADAKRFMSADEFHRLSEDLAFKIADDGLKPTFLIAPWRGGTVPGMIVQEILQRVHKIDIDHVAVRTQSRDVQGNALPKVIIHGIGHALNVLTEDSVLLIVDDVSDSGNTNAALLKELKEKLGPRMPRIVKLATVFYKEEKLKPGNPVPDYFVENSRDWLVFPHELEELSDEEIRAKRPRVWAYMHKQ